MRACERWGLLAVLTLWSLAGCIPSRMGPSTAWAASTPPKASLPRLPPPDAPAPTPAPAAPASPPAPLPSPAQDAEPANKYAWLSGDACELELRRRGIPYAPAPGMAPGVERPIQLTGPLRGVEIHEPGPRSSWHRSVNEILDCRLALSLDDFAGVLLEHDVVEVVHVSFYRKNAKIARKGTPSQHASGRAIDLSVLIKKDGTRMDVRRDWNGKIGDRSCGPQASPPTEDTPSARELRRIICETASKGIFHIFLTPNFNHDHRDHFHLDISQKKSNAEVK